MLLTDGKDTVDAMLALSLNHLVNDRQLKANAVVRLEAFMKRVVAGTPVLVVLRMTVIKS
jgi:hypothetical protein